MAKKKTDVKIDLNEMLQRLKALRKDKNLKEEYLAEELGIDTDTYADKEKGEISFSVKEWLMMSNIMNVRLFYFLTGNS